MPTSVLSWGFSLAAPATGQITAIYENAVQFDPLAITGAGTFAVDLASIPATGTIGLKIALDAVDGSGSAVTTPVAIHWTENGNANIKWISPGSWLAWADLTPTYPISALQIVTTANALLHITLLG